MGHQEEEIKASFGSDRQAYLSGHFKRLMNKKFSALVMFYFLCINDKTLGDTFSWMDYSLNVSLWTLLDYIFPKEMHILWS